MKYHNDKTYESDMDCNGSFRIDQVAPISDIAKTMEDVFANLGNAPSSQVEQALLFFGCSQDELEVLALLTHYDGYLSSPSRIAELLNKTESAIDPALKDLFDKGLINQIPDTEAVILTKAASLAITKSAPIEELNDYEFIEALSEIDDESSSLKLNSILMKVNALLESDPHGRIASFVQEYHITKLSKEAQKLFWKMCGSYVVNFIDAYSGSISKTHLKELAKLGLVESFAVADNNDLTKKDNYCLSARAAAKLFAGKETIINYANVAAIGRFLPWNEIEEKPLFFCKSDIEAITKLERMAGESEYVKICKALAARKLRVSLSAILHGPAGTGKTELTMQIARKTRRNLIMVDAAKLHGSFWGEDERNYREMFRIFRHIEALSKRPPILFIDEGEGILGKRVSNASTRGDRSTNVVQNIILEELNGFRGLLFVTTNDVTNIDKAMDRRFLMKVEFHIPDEKTRKDLWVSKLPEISESTASALAKQFAFSGGHIDNVITKAYIDDALDGITFDYDSLAKYCHEEQDFTSMSSPRAIGF